MGKNTRPPKVTRPRPFLQPAVRAAMKPMTTERLTKALAKVAAPPPISAGGGRLIREDLEPVLYGLFAKSFPSLATKHSWHPPYGTMMRSPEDHVGMALGSGSVYNFDLDQIEGPEHWETDDE